MEHNHNHEQSASLKNLIFAMVVNGGIVAFEIFFGLLFKIALPRQLYQNRKSGQFYLLTTGFFISDDFIADSEKKLDIKLTGLYICH